MSLPPLRSRYSSLTLPTENPYDAAQKFLTANQLPMTYLDEVVNFITKNSGGVELGTGAPSADPYTGGQAYRTSGSQGTQSAAPAPSMPRASTSSFPFVRFISLTVSLRGLG